MLTQQLSCVYTQLYHAYTHTYKPPHPRTHVPPPFPHPPTLTPTHLHPHLNPHKPPSPHPTMHPPSAPPTDRRPDRRSHKTHPQPTLRARGGWLHGSRSLWVELLIPFHLPALKTQATVHRVDKNITCFYAAVVGAHNFPLALQKLTLRHHSPVCAR